MIFVMPVISLTQNLNQVNARSNTQVENPLIQRNSRPQGFLAALLALGLGSSFFFFDRLLPPLGR
jgi:hypothetical protein